MVMAKLHVICGNCGSANGFDWEYKQDDVYIGCKNCATLHALNDNAEPIGASEDSKKESRHGSS